VDDLADLGDLDGRNDLRAGDRHVNSPPLRRRAAAPCGHRYAGGEISEAAFTNEAASAYKANLVEYR
jgi:hypothetical protein